MESYKDLIVWRKSMILAKEIYNLTKRLPHEEKYVLSDQMRRAAISIPSNIAEGYGRNSTKEYVRFLNIARGSEFELETQIHLCVMLDYFNENDVYDILNTISEINKMLNSLMKKLQPHNE